MPEICCCVPGCSNRGRHAFPSDQTRRKSWIHAIRRGETRFQSWEPSAHAVVCRSHFKESDYYTETVHGKILHFPQLYLKMITEKFYLTLKYYAQGKVR
jgi:hypothetical protein